VISAGVLAMLQRSAPEIDEKLNRIAKPAFEEGASRLERTPQISIVETDQHQAGVSSGIPKSKVDLTRRSGARKPW
jgi:hypothetical protein